ncbi:trimeric intracellular cation channel family protein [Shewanella olleyana]|uniref:trimeric intracellular cation channel family protein n=1 Tax=Shewanella olleyana TaxID=135626 RepID=UPI00200FB3A8|nr:trimeric intracellular cation channel family protein [Shewanella olleyana]MCL1067404.1 trimeric intracellular cation channel family protein [Shewanella olleyana]
MFISTTFIEVITILGTAAFSASAVLAANDREIDLFSIIVLGIIAAVGGGTIRDCLLDTPVFWAEDMSYIYIASASAIVCFYTISFLKKKWISEIYLYIDAIAIAMFCIQGTEKAWALGFGLPVAPVILGTMTAVGGGIVRDIILQRPSLILSKELYAIPVCLGAIIHAVTLAYLPDYSEISALAAAFVIIYLRHLSIQKNLVVPNWALLNLKK